MSAARPSNRRALVWALMGVGGIVAYFLLVEPALELGASLRARAEALSQTLAEVRRGAVAAERDVQTVSLGRRQFGDVAMPGDPRERPIEFNRRIAEALREAGIERHESRSRPGSIARGPLQAALETDRIEAMVVELDFEATPEQVSQVVAALELCPEVTAITRIHLDRAASGSRRLTATLTLESWIVARGAQR